MKLRIEKLEKERETMGLTKRAFAALLGMHESSYGMILKRKTTTFTNLSYIAEKLELDPKDLLIS